MTQDIQQDELFICLVARWSAISLAFYLSTSFVEDGAWELPVLENLRTSTCQRTQKMQKGTCNCLSWCLKTHCHFAVHSDINKTPPLLLLSMSEIHNIPLFPQAESCDNQLTHCSIETTLKNSIYDYIYHYIKSKYDTEKMYSYPIHFLSNSASCFSRSSRCSFCACVGPRWDFAIHYSTLCFTSTVSFH